jgi:hypothetical protein
VHTKLDLLILNDENYVQFTGNPLETKNDACYYLLNLGIDIVDCLLSIISEEENSVPRNMPG